jgi:hypothetical protein
MDDPWATFGDSQVESLLPYVRQTHRWFEEAVADLDDPVFLARATRTAPSIAFHLWHMGRWADVSQARIPDMGAALGRLGPRTEIWVRDGLRARWGLPELLGLDGSGAELGDDASAALPLPGKDEVLGYVRSAFSALEEVLGRITDAELLDRCSDVFGDPSNVADFFLFELSHGSRHLGMIEALKGIYGGHGTVTE